MSRNYPSKQRVICIGWHKTGTSTIGDALLKLGYHVVGCREDLAYPLIEGNVKPAIELASEFDAVQDVPWAALFRELDEAYPGCKFILTIRDDQKWLRSASNHFGETDFMLHKWLYGKGVLAGNQDLYLKRYQQHNTDVISYFKDRNDDLLVMNFENGDGWDKLCPFLGESVPNMPFPHSNKGKHSYNTKDKIINTARSMVPQFIRKWRLELMIKMGKPDPRNRFNNAEQNRMERQKRLNAQKK